MSFDTGTHTGRQGKECVYTGGMSNGLPWANTDLGLLEGPQPGLVSDGLGKPACRVPLTLPRGLARGK